MHPLISAYRNMWAQEAYYQAAKENSGFSYDDVQPFRIKSSDAFRWYQELQQLPAGLR